MDIENLTLKPIPPKLLHCKACKTDFISHLKMNAEFYKTCDECRNKTFALSACSLVGWVGSAATLWSVVRCLRVSNPASPPAGRHCGWR